MIGKMDLTLLAHFLKQVHDIDISVYDESFFRKSIEKRIQATRCGTLEDYCAYLQQNDGEGKTFLDSLHIGYSEFFRNPLTFALLERVILPELIQKRKAGGQREIRIWSAGCAAGQEAYTIAILLEEWKTCTNEPLNYRIFATDVDETLLDQARLGQYPAEALKNVSLKRAQTWFTRQDDVYVVHPAVRQQIEFSRFDLLEAGLGCPPASIFGDFDLALCCNVLLYYRSQYRDSILNKFEHCITRGGYLVTGETERSIALAHRFTEIAPQSAVFRINQ
jgi:chemotaxis protein methyltransferase CheR